MEAVMFRKRSVVPALALLMLLHPSGSNAQVTVDFVSDTSWQVNAMNTDGSRGALLGAAQCACLVPGWGCQQEGLQNIASGLPGSCEIWMPGLTAESIADLRGAYFTKTFNLSDQPVGRA